MGNSNKKQARSASNPDQKVENIPKNEQQQENQNNIISVTPVQCESQLSPKINHQKGFHSRKRIINEKRSSSAHLREKKNSSLSNTPKSNKNAQITQEERNNDKSQFSKQIKVCNGNGEGEGKAKKCLEDLMQYEIQKLKNWSPPKNIKYNQALNPPQQKQRQIISQTQNICSYNNHINLNQSQLQSNLSHFHTQSNSPSQIGKKSFSPNARSMLYVSRQNQNTNASKEIEANNIDKQQNLNSLKKERIRISKYDSYSSSPLTRSLTNPRRQQNWELILKQTQHREIPTTQNVQNHKLNNSFQQGNQTISVIESKQIQSEMNQSNTVSLNQHCEQFSQNPYIKCTTKQFSPRRIQQLFSINEGGRKISLPNNKSKEKEKNNYLKQINLILEKKYASNSKKKLQFEKIEPYVRSQSQNSSGPHDYQTPLRKPEMIMSMHSVNSPANVVNDVEFYRKSASAKKRRPASSEQSPNQNANRNLNRFLRSQINPISHRSRSNGSRDPLKNLSRFRYQIPYQIDFDSEQYNILQRNNVNNFVHFSRDDQQSQQQNTFYTNMRKSQEQNQDINNSTIKDQPNIQPENSNIQLNQGNIQQQFQNYNQQNQVDSKIQSTNNLKNTQTQSPIIDNQKTFSPMNKDYLASSMMTSTKNNFDNSSQQFQDSQFGFQDFNNNHLNNGFERMKIRKYQNNSQIGILSNSDIYKIYMKNPLLDVFNSTHKQSQKTNSIFAGNQHQDIMSQSFTVNPTYQQSNNNGMNNIQESKDFQRYKLIKTYQPSKLKHTKTQQF